MDTINKDLLLLAFEQSGFSYTGLAEDIGISRNTVRNIMFGYTNPSHYVSVSIAEALNLTPDDIIAIFFPNIKMNDLQDEMS